MERIRLSCSLKIFPIPTKSSCQLKLIEKIQSIIKRMRWKTFFFLRDNNNINKTNSNDINESGKQTFGFKSKQNPAQIHELQSFQNYLLDIIKSIQFRNAKDDFQTKMNSNISNKKSSPNMFVSEDKTTNLYEILLNDYKKLLYEDITKTYKKSTNRLEYAINMEAKHIAKNIKLDDQIESLTKIPTFIILKDYKENFRSSHPCRLINPSKSELGKVSKTILKKVNTILVDSPKVNQWKDTDDVINWFNAIKDKSQCCLFYSIRHSRILP